MDIESSMKKTFDKGDLLVAQGEHSSRMYVLNTGKLRVVKYEGGCSREIAILGPGAVLGELCLIAPQPSPTTVQVLRKSTVSVIERNDVENVLQSAPEWICFLYRFFEKTIRRSLSSSKTSPANQDIEGMLRIMLLLRDSAAKAHGREFTLPLQQLTFTVHTVMALEDSQMEAGLLHLILKELLLVKRDAMGREYIVIPDYLLIEAYMSFLRSHRNGFRFPAEHLSESALELIDCILSSRDNSGRLEDGTSVCTSAFLQKSRTRRRGHLREVPLRALDELIEFNLVHTETVPKGFGKQEQSEIAYRPKTLQKVQLSKIWLPVFRETISL